MARCAPRFDVIGGVFYFLLVVSVLPRCSRMAELLEADTLGEAPRGRGAGSMCHGARVAGRRR